MAAILEQPTTTCISPPSLLHPAAESSLENLNLIAPRPAGDSRRSWGQTERLTVYTAMSKSPSFPYTAWPPRRVFSLGLTWFALQPLGSERLTSRCLPQAKTTRWGQGSKVKGEGGAFMLSPSRGFSRLSAPPHSSSPAFCLCPSEGTKQGEVGGKKESRVAKGKKGRKKGLL